LNTLQALGRQVVSQLELRLKLRDLHETQMQLVQREKLSSLGQLVAGVAHEINNPINFIYGNLAHVNDYTQDLLTILERYQTLVPEPPADLQKEIEAIDLDFLKTDIIKVLESMGSGTNRVREIVLSLRNFARLDEADFKVVNVHEGLDSTLTILQSRLKAQPDRPALALQKDYGPVPEVECLPGQLNQVFMNILSNAIDALRENPGTASPCITIRTQAIAPDWIAIHIADNGVGIAEDIQTKLFDPFFTTKEVGKGTGLGLSISQNIVTEKHGGRLRCHSRPGAGTEFVIELPVHQGVQPPTPALLSTR
jgi:signal transduction histidine kinase